MTGPKDKGGPAGVRETAQEAGGPTGAKGVYSTVGHARARLPAKSEADAREIVRLAGQTDHTIVASRRACIRALVKTGRTERGKLAPILATVWPLAVVTIEDDITEAMRTIAEQEPQFIRDYMHESHMRQFALLERASRMLADLALGDNGVQVQTTRDLKEWSEAFKNIIDTERQALEGFGKTHGVIQASQAVNVSFKLEVGGSKLELTRAQVASALQMVTESFGEACGELLSPEVAARVMGLAGEKLARRSAEDVT